MVLIVFLSSRISPRASTVIFCDRSPFATAVVTFAMLRTWSVKLPASTLTLSVRSFHVPATPGTTACAPSMPSAPTALTARVDGDFLGEVAARDGRRDLGDVAHLRGQIVGEQVDVVRQILPRARYARHHGLRAQNAIDAYGARHVRDLLSEHAQRVRH